MPKCLVSPLAGALKGDSPAFFLGLKKAGCLFGKLWKNAFKVWKGRCICVPGSWQSLENARRSHTGIFSVHFQCLSARRPHECGSLARRWLSVWL